MKTLLLTTAAALAVTAATPVLAQSAGDWTIGIGIANVNPKSDNGELAGADASIDSNTQLSLTAEYFFTPNIGLEILAATPFSHTVSLSGLGDVVDTDHLPPTVSLNYHFTQFNGFKPYVGVGLNYTTFFEEKGKGALDGLDVELDDSFGLAFQVGVDIPVSERGALRLNARYIDIETDVEVEGLGKVGTAEIDPLVLNVAYVFSF